MLASRSLIAAVLLLPGSVHAHQTKVAAELRDSVSASRAAYALVESFTKVAGGRIPGTRADSIAQRWIADRLAATRVDSIWTQPVPVSTWQRGRESAQILGTAAADIVVAAFGFSPATPDTGVVGSVVRFASARQLIAAPASELRNRIVFLDRRLQRAQDGRGYVAAVQDRPAAIAHAARSGALALLVRSTGSSQTRTPHVSNLAPSAGNVLPVAAVANPDADVLAQRTSSGAPVQLRVILTGRSGPPGASANIIAEIRGAELPDEIVLLGAHHDSWDLGTGATDDAVGVGIVLDVARRIAALERRPRRTIRIVLFAAEEQGLAGARTYAGSLRDNHGHVLALEPDQGAGKPYRVRAQLGENSSLLAEIAELLLPLGIDWLPDPSVAGPDLIPLRARGVPTVDVAQDNMELWDHAHSANDTFDKVSADALAATAAAYAVITYLAADWPDSITR